MIGPRKVDRPLVLYGYGKLGHLAEEIFKELRIPVTAIITKSDLKDLEDDYWNKLRKDFLLAICVATEPYNQVIAPLVAAGWTDIVSVWDIIEAYPKVRIGNGWFAGPFLDEEYRECGRILDLLEDGISRTHYLEHLDYRQYRRGHPLFVIEPPEQDSLPSTLADIRRRQKIILWSDCHHTFWNSYGDSGTVYIHQEGKEMETLMANIEVFRKYRPKIQVSSYHSRDGLWKIPKYLMDNLPDYKWTFRLHAFMGQAAYIYGTPKERI